MHRVRFWIIVILVLFVGYLVLSFFPTLYTDYLWFLNIGYTEVFLKFIYMKLIFGFAVGLVTALLFFLNTSIAARRADRPRVVPADNVPDIFDRLVTPQRITFFLALVSILLGVLIGSGSSGLWLRFEQFRNASPFDLADPIFGRDVSFYVFILPFLRSLYSLGWLWIIISFLGAAAVYFLSGRLIKRGVFAPDAGATRHLGILAALGFFLKAYGYRLNAYDLLYSARGIVFGAGYTDVNATLPVLKIMSVLAVLVGLYVLFSAWRTRLNAIYAGLIFIVAASLLAGTGYPVILQNFRVEPNERTLERPFIENNINMTRAAYGLDRIAIRDFEPGPPLDAADIEANRGTLENIRLWDWRPLKQTYRQLQEFRPQYVFEDVDVDRYMIDGRLRQVMLSARELDVNKLSADAQTWVNRYLVYTHGFGLTMSPASRATPEGLPELVIRDIPVKSDVEINIENPRIYYGERTDNYVIARTKEGEFDFPLGDKNAVTSYDGAGGVRIGSFVNKLVFALRLPSYRMLFSSQITNDSRVLFYRDIKQRVNRIAPFLQYDHDPYLVVSGGKLYWIIDAYTTSSSFPYSTPWENRLNYIRNSVKVVVGACDGDVTFYVFDKQDPLVKTYAKIFPGLFKSSEDMPEELKAHVRYPLDIFTIQADMYETYHITNPSTFYSGEDFWARPTEVFRGEEDEMKPYYLIMRLPDKEQEEFLLLQPFTPINKQVMIGWLAARSDAENYGELVIFRFPKGSLAFGPMQIEGRIDQDAEISRNISLWSQRGSQVIRGNLLVIPIEDNVLYVEPLFLQAESGELPELRRVIAVYRNRIVMEPTLEAALARVFNIEAPPEPGPDQPPVAGTLRDLVDEARSAFEAAQSRAREGDWAGFGDALDSLGEALARLSEMADKDGAPPLDAEQQ